jgi:hypothetical protein
MRRLWALFPLFLLAGCNSSSVFLENVQSGDVLYQETFSDPESGWERTTAEVGLLDYYNGVYRITVNTSDYDLWAVAGVNFNDVRLEVDAARFGGPDENRFGLVCRYRDALDFYFFVISSDGYYAIGKVSGGTLSLLGQPMMAYNNAIVTGVAPNHIRFDCVGNALTGYVNGQMVAITQDISFTAGDVGLMAGAFDTNGVDIVFDDFVVIKP